jgi:hypothetical protein
MTVITDFIRVYASASIAVSIIAGGKQDTYRTHAVKSWFQVLHKDHILYRWVNEKVICDNSSQKQKFLKFPLNFEGIFY